MQALTFLSPFSLFTRTYTESFAEQTLTASTGSKSKAGYHIQEVGTWFLSSEHCSLFKAEVKLLLVTRCSNSSNNCKQCNFGLWSSKMPSPAVLSWLPRSTASCFHTGAYVSVKGENKAQSLASHSVASAGSPGTSAGPGSRAGPWHVWWDREQGIGHIPTCTRGSKGGEI